MLSDENHGFSPQGARNQVRKKENTTKIPEGKTSKRQFSFSFRTSPFHSLSTKTYILLYTEKTGVRGYEFPPTSLPAACPLLTNWIPLLNSTVSSLTPLPTHILTEAKNSLTASLFCPRVTFKESPNNIPKDNHQFIINLLFKNKSFPLEECFHFEDEVENHLEENQMPSILIIGQV